MALRVAVLPRGVRDFLDAAVVEGGGVLAGPEQADMLVWVHPSDAEGLRALLAQHKQVKTVQLPWAGIEPYVGVLDDAHTWTAGQGVYAEPVAEHAVALAVALLRGYRHYARAATWDRREGTSLFDKHVVIFGAGGIGRVLQQLLAPYRCRVSFVRHKREPVPGAHLTVPLADRERVLADADVVILALALTDATRGVIGVRELAAMPRGAVLINVARGAHVDTNALVDALRMERLAGAALDVTEPEPLPPGHPLWHEPRCWITPHVANTPSMAVPLLSQRVRENVRRARLGEPLLGLVDVRAGY